MLKQTIEYTDYEGNKKTEDFWFNLNKAELMEMQLSTKGGFAESLQKIMDDNDTPKIMAVFKNIILKAYGERVLDDNGNTVRFNKSAEISANFAQTEAYSELFMKLLSDEKAATEFMNGIVPNDLRQNGANAIPVSTK